jgi:hypothetical protein
MCRSLDQVRQMAADRRDRVYWERLRCRDAKTAAREVARKLKKSACTTALAHERKVRIKLRKQVIPSAAAAAAATDAATAVAAAAAIAAAPAAPAVAAAASAAPDDAAAAAAAAAVESWRFSPVDHKWQQQQCSLIGIKLVLKHVPRIKRQTTFDRLTSPTTSINVRGDGNCFYRVLSIAAAGTESHHTIIRDKLIAFMSQDRIRFQLYDMYPDFNIETASTAGHWATDAEIFVAAAFLCTDIFVFVNTHSIGWQVYESARLGDRAIHENNVYIKHGGNHFYFVKGLKGCV